MHKAIPIVFFLLIYGFLPAQDLTPFNPIIEQIGSLEDNRDPKCHATASRLEDFIYGTPLSFDARNQRIQSQEDYVYTIWKAFSVQSQLIFYLPYPYQRLKKEVHVIREYQLSLMVCLEGHSTKV